MTKTTKKDVLYNLLNQYYDKWNYANMSIKKMKKMGLEPSPETLAALQTYDDIINAIHTLLDHLEWGITK